MQSLLLAILVLLSIVLLVQSQSSDEYVYEAEAPARGVNMLQQGYGMGYRQNRLNTRSFQDRIRSLKENYQKSDLRGAVFG